MSNLLVDNIYVAIMRSDLLGHYKDSGKLFAGSMEDITQEIAEYFDDTGFVLNYVFFKIDSTTPYTPKITLEKE